MQQTIELQMKTVLLEVCGNPDAYIQSLARPPLKASAK